MTHTPVTFEVKGYNSKGVCVDSRTYHTPKLNALGGHWMVCQRMASTLLKNRKVKVVRYYMDGIEYVYDADQYEFIKA
tara:strand:- start:10386 stop:10619 length:234 start_codon:yes stop_codon:yes gene_type:complete